MTKEELSTLAEEVQRTYEEFVDSLSDLLGEIDDPDKYKALVAHPEDATAILEL